MNVFDVDNFLSKQNTDILWDLVIDDEMIKSKTIIQREQVGLFFQKILREFNEREKSAHKNLFTMNKSFITTFLTILNTYYNSQTQQTQPVSQPVLMTHEQLHEQRQSQFEKDLSRRQQEFSQSMTLQVPKQPKFNDEVDLPLGEIDARLKQMTARREQELLQITQSTEKQKGLDWLKPIETSLQQEKIFIQITKENVESAVIKKDVVDLNKQLTWGDNQIFPLQEEDQHSIDPILMEKLDSIQKQIQNLSQTLEAHMERCNSTLAILYTQLNKISNENKPT